MTEPTPRLSFDEFDEARNPRPELCDFDHVVESAISRRGFLSVLAVGTAAFLADAGRFVGAAQAATDRFGFTGIAATTADTITIAQGFDWTPVVSWGDALWSDAPAWDWATRGTAAAQERAMGDNTDGMFTFVHGAHTLLAANNEYTNLELIHGNNASKKPESDDDILKNMLAHGVTVMEIAQTDGKWAVVKDSPFNRRITPKVPTKLSGPVAGSDFVKTAADPTGTTVMGTWNNCAAGKTPWGTYLTCEENFNGYFASSDPAVAITPALKRYGIDAEGWGYDWHKIDPRFDLAKEPNEVNRGGWVVEIDPTDPKSTPIKRTALGRFKHENAEVVIAANGRVVVYLGDDERGEFLYRYVSNGVYSLGGDNSTLLDDGTLYVARFSDDQRGEWLALTPETTGMASLAEVLVHTRQAGSKVGATTMDRPEWVTVNPRKAEVYVALTNNRNRGVKPNAGGDETPATGPNPRKENNYGQIVRWTPDNGDHTAAGFGWNIFVLAGNPSIHKDTYAGTPNVTLDNMFNSPDGIGFDENGLLWIQTDGNYSNEKDFAGQGNNQMLAADPETGEIRRFLVGPVACEVTGLCWSPDRRTMFVGIQHPGEEDKGSTFPGGAGTFPRSTIIAVTRKDGQLIG